MKYDVLVQLEIAFNVSLDADDEIDAAHRVLALDKDWIDHAARDPEATMDWRELQICREDLFDGVRTLEEMQQRDKSVVFFSADQINDLFSHVWATMTDEQKDKCRYRPKDNQ